MNPDDRTGPWYRSCCAEPKEYAIEKTVAVHTVTHVIEEDGVRVKLSVTDTPGFGDQLDNSKW